MKFMKIFVNFAGGLLLAAALTRFLIASENEPLLQLPEPIIGIPIRYMVLLVGCLELFVALICLFGRRTDLQFAWLAWLATSYVAFWIGLLATNCHPQASCIGSLTDPLELSHGVVGIVIGWLTLPLFVGSYAGWVWLWLENRRPQTAIDSKISCPACGVHIRVDLLNVGQKISCPHCKMDITLKETT